MSHHDTIVIENQLPISELLERAAQGDNECRYWAGMRYFLADGLPKDDEEGYRLCLAAAEQGHRRAQAFVGYFYSRGIVVPYRPKLSIKWYRLSAEQGYAAAQYSLATFYLSGKGVKKNIRRAIKWLEMAAAQGDRDAIEQLEDIYNVGNYAIKNSNKAYRCELIVAKEKGDFGIRNRLRKYKTGVVKTIISYGYDIHSIVFSKRTFDRIAVGTVVEIRGQGFSWEGRFDQDYWIFNHNFPGSIQIYTDDGADIFDGKVEDGTVWFIQYLREVKKRVRAR